MSRDAEAKHAEQRARVDAAVRFIAANLHRPLALTEVAAAAHLSEFHFHRLLLWLRRLAPGAAARVVEGIGLRALARLDTLRLAPETDESPSPS